MYTASPRFHSVCSYVDGYVQASGDDFLIGFNRWLEARGKSRPELAWEWKVLCEIYPEDALPHPARLQDEEDAAAVAVLFELLNAYIQSLPREGVGL